MRTLSPTARDRTYVHIPNLPAEAKPVAPGWQFATMLPLPSHLWPAYNTPPGRLQDDPVYKAHRQDWLTYQTRWVSPQKFRDAMRP